MAALVAVALGAPWRDGTPGIVDRAAAAIGDGRVLHLVTQSDTAEILVHLDTGKRDIQRVVTESWSDDASDRFHVIIRYRGRIVSEFVLPEDLKNGVIGAEGGGEVDPAYAALSTGYRQALEDGKARLESKGVYKGRPVYWLRFEPLNPRTRGTLVAIDPATYRPLVLRFPVSAKRHLDQEVLSIETLPFDANQFRRVWLPLKQQIHSGGESVVTGEVQPPRKGRDLLKAPWLAAGGHLAAMRLNSVHTFTMASDSGVSQGMELGYGPTEHGFPERRGRYLIIQELQRPDDDLVWKRIPPDVISVTEGEFSDLHGSHTQWVGKLRKYRIYVTIESSAGEPAVVAAARALRPAP